ncbi:helix-turn-helix domain-containing protein [Fannyhessea vaginae]|uniref:helix-turn-helix domain-containing protein n=1 Tax=Fannyhessea vaginae TaxID=82135 RepID=UPI00206ADFF7|nr:helix-turn-helix transcriptional regulator [Fannyhessea vaginae]DAK30231.1 MAG TPA: helix-turn-helix domain protein [Caudoviricetes sp.]
MLFRDVLRTEMKEKGVSVIRLAERLNTTRSYVYQLLNGEIKEPTLNRALDICDALDISIDELVEKIKQGDSD